VDHPSLARAAAALQESGDNPGGRKKREVYKVPEGEYFILADDPADAGALDSREMGGVPGQGIHGVVKAVWWPLWRVRKLH
jgi:hypothetical protein